MANPLVMPGVPIGGSIVILCIILLLYSMLRSFKRTGTIDKPMKISAISVFIGFIIYTFCFIVGQAVIPRHECAIRIPIALGSFLFSRGLFFYFLIIRIQVSFQDSVLALSPCFINTLKSITVIVYGLCMVAQCVFAPYQIYQNDICFITDELFPAYTAVSGIYILTDFALGVVVVGTYLYRLHKLYQEMKDIGAMEATPSNANTRLLSTIKKQAKLAFIAYLSTVFIVMAAPASGITYFGHMDALINVLCVYCTFDANHRWYAYLCDCNGIKALQIVFCFCCCCCCNEVEQREQEKATHSKTIEDVDSNTSQGSNNNASDGCTV